MVIIILILLLAVSFTVISKEYFGTFINHYTLFNIWWGGLAFFSFLNVSPLNKPSNETYWIILIGTFAFNLSMYTGKVKLSKLKIDQSQLHINVKLLLLLQILVFYFLFPYFLKGLAISQESSMAHLKAGLVEAFSDSQLEVIKIYWFCEPMIISSIFLACFVFYFRKGSLLLIIFTVVNVVIFSFAFGGRIQMFRMSIILLILSFFKSYITGDAKVIANRTKLSYYMIFGFIVLMSIFTQERSWGPATDYFKMFNIYFLGSLSLLDHFITHPSISHLNGDLMFGRASLAAFIDPFILFGGKVLGIHDFTTKVMGVNMINDVQEKFYVVGKGYSMNAFSTMYYPFMRDFGIFGIIIFPFLLGCTLNLCIKKVDKSRNLYLFIIYILLCYILIFASNRWELVNFWPFGSIFYIYIIVNRRFNF